MEFDLLKVGMTVIGTNGVAWKICALYSFGDQQVQDPTGTWHCCEYLSPVDEGE